MCRYAETNYKSHFACFDCRKAFKKVSIDDWSEQKGLDYAYRKLAQNRCLSDRQAEEEFGTTYASLRDRYIQDVAICPQCGGTMAAMGLDFRAPKTEAIEEWEVLRVLYEHGFAFHGCGCSVGYTPPRKLNGLAAFFREHERRSDGLLLLERLNQQGS